MSSTHRGSVPSLLPTLGALLLLSSGTAVAQPPRPPERHALLIGINSYDHFRPQDRRQLKYAVNDVTELAVELNEKGWRVKSLVNQYATRDLILTELSDYARSLREVDTFMLFFAGHGVRNPRTKMAYWMTRDTSLGYLDVRGLRLAHLIQYVTEIPAGRKIVLLDHCFSGNVDLPAVTLGSVTRGPGDPIPAPGVRTDVFPDVELLQQMEPQSEGLVVITAAQDLALEVPDPENAAKGHGVFTTALLKALQTTEADTDDPRGILTIEELGSYLVGDESSPMGEVQRIAAAHSGFQQRADMKSTIVGSGGWVIAELAGLSADVEYEAHTEVLGAWFLKGWLDAHALSECRQVLDTWRDLGFVDEDMEEAELSILATIRRAMQGVGDENEYVFAEALSGSFRE